MRAGERRRALQALGFPGVEEAKARLTALGRYGQMPWCHAEFADTLTYISPRDLLLLPSWHMWCRGILRDMWLVALLTPLKDVPSDHPFIFNGPARQQVTVCCSCWCLPYDEHAGLPES